MKILSIETTGNICGAALVCDNEVIAERNIFLPKNSSSKIFEIIKSITRRHKFDAVAVDIGPGSFTGCRIGVSLSRAYGQFLKLPVVPVSSLDCMVFNAVKKRKIYGKIFPVIDALRDEIYTAVYNGLKRKSEYRIIKVEKFLKMLDNKSTIVGSCEICKKISVKKYVVTDISASSVGFVAMSKLKKNKNYGYNEVLPLYIRRVFAEERYADCKSTKRY
ncbi:MAG TPA: tRNA (adenosine(37)-N6)-threonylcarbamoyltransferase complex dimerization subunit type 1 TsaB [Elusimicrobia bacterium]|nr:tRNA (adenosine(37)-N6)-threonylcarbamoyltransferase complex dimerization subunit type 1 TsaB [Elusimicrobiota bacterium]